MSSIKLSEHFKPISASLRVIGVSGPQTAF